MSKKDREVSRATRAAAIRKGQSDRERNRKISIVAVIVLVLGGLVAGGFFLSGRSTEATKASGGSTKVTASGQALVVGDSDAKVKVIVYEDFLCPYCREFEASSRDLLRENAAAGKVLIEYRPFQLLPDPYSSAALTAWGAVLQKGTPMQALAFHDLLFSNQPYEAAADKPGADEFAEWATDAGVEDQQVLDALMGPDPAFVDAADATAEQAGIKGTPTVLVNGKELAGASIADMTKQLEQMLGTTG